MPAPGHEPFLRAICEAPDDDAPRLIYADWLDENGDSDRAEFIRLQVGIGDNVAVEVQNGQFRCEELFRINHRRWVDALPGTAALWSEFRFEGIPGPNANWIEVTDQDSRQLTWVDSHPVFDDWERGFPATVYVQSSSDVFLACLDEITDLVPVHRLRMILLRNADSLISTLAKSPFLKKIRELIVPPDVILSNSTVTALASSPYASQLRQLSLVAEQLSDSTGMALFNSPCLREIQMLQLLRNELSGSVRAALRSRFGFAVYC